MGQHDSDSFWDGLPSLVGRDPGMLSGAPVVRDEQGYLTGLPVDILTENIEAFMELKGMTQEQAIDATLECFPGTPGGKDTLRKLLAYEEARLNQMHLA